MLEFYQAYATFEDFIELTEELICGLVEEVNIENEGIPLELTYQGQVLDFSRPWKRMTLCEAIKNYLRQHKSPKVQGCAQSDLNDLRELKKIAQKTQVSFDEKTDVGAFQARLFEELVEGQLIQPTFITQYPVAVSPLSRRNRENPEYTDRFELIVCGREIANAFSELNDPLDQKSRFDAQVQKRQLGDEEAMYFDEDFIRALECGMPPTAGEGIGIDRLIMLLTDAPSIREVILFPLLRPEKLSKH